MNVLTGEAGFSQDLCLGAGCNFLPKRVSGEYHSTDLDWEENTLLSKLSIAEQLLLNRQFLLYRNGFGQVARLIHITAASYCYVIG